MVATLRRIQACNTNQYGWVISNVQFELCPDPANSGRKGLYAKLTDADFQSFKSVWSKDVENSLRTIFVTSNNEAHFLCHEQYCMLRG